MNILKEKLYNKQTVYGTWCSLSSTNAVNSIAFSGLDFIVIDLEHGSTNFETAENMTRAAETANCSPIIRCSSLSQEHLLRCLEIGTKSIFVPNVNSKAQAENVVKYCLYQPLGNRGLSPYTRIHKYSDDNLKNKLIEANEDLLIGILVEGSNGLENLKDICEVEYLDIIYLGLFDICQSVGLPGQIDHPQVVEKLKDYQSIISNAGKIAGCMSASVDYAKTLKNKNYNFIAYLNDAAALKKHFENFLKEIK